MANRHAVAVGTSSRSFFERRRYQRMGNQFDTAERNGRMAACLSKAAECEEQASRVREPGLKQQWLDLARQWRELARQIEVSRY